MAIKLISALDILQIVSSDFEEFADRNSSVFAPLNGTNNSTTDQIYYLKPTDLR